MRRLPFILSMLGFAFATIPVSATSLYCSTCANTPAEFVTATGSLSMTTILFSGSVDPVAGYTNSGVTFTELYGDNTDLTISGGTLTDTKSPDPGITISLPSDVVAFSFDIEGNNGGTGSIAFYGPGYSGATVDFTASPVFFGAIPTSAPITSLQITASLPITISNFEIFTDASPAPDPGTFFTMGGGLLGLYFCRRPRLRKRSEQAQKPSGSQGPLA